MNRCSDHLGYNPKCRACVAYARYCASDELRQARAEPVEAYISSAHKSVAVESARQRVEQLTTEEHETPELGPRVINCDDSVADLAEHWVDCSFTEMTPFERAHRIRELASLLQRTIEGWLEDYNV